MPDAGGGTGESSHGARGSSVSHSSSNNNNNNSSHRTSHTTSHEPPLKMRMFAVIICDECLYLEFPGCDIHGALYTERVVDDGGTGASGKKPMSGGVGGSGTNTGTPARASATGGSTASTSSATFTSVSTPVISIAPRPSGPSGVPGGGPSSAINTSVTSSVSSSSVSRSVSTTTRSMSVSSSAGAVASEGSATGTSTAATASAAVIAAAEPAALVEGSSRSHGGAGESSSDTVCSRIQAKCPHCSSATNNVRPFKDGCRRCKGSTRVFMWATTLEEISQAHDCFPTLKEEVEHTVLKCELCQSVIFPRARDTLTRRTQQHLLVASNSKALKISNFQLSMPHVDGCPRKGMPLQSVPVQLPKSELKFVQERIENCPLAPRIQGGPQYRPRKREVITHQNHLSQIFLRLLSVIIKTFDATSPNAIDPLRQILTLFNKLKPLDLFRDWSPSRQLSGVCHKPAKVIASSELDCQYGPSRILDSDSSSYWRSAEPKDPSATPGGAESSTHREEWLCFQFATPVAISSIVIRWHPDHLPNNVAISVSDDDVTYQPVALVVHPKKESRFSFAKATAVSFVRISMYASDTSATSSSPPSYGLVSVLFLETGFSSLDTPTEQLLENLEQWLLKASLSSCVQVREVALQALQRLSLASGSLCGLLRLASAMLFNSIEGFDSTASSKKRLSYDSKVWHERDQLSDASRASTREFIFQLASSISNLMNPSASSSRSASNGLSGSAIEKRIIRKMSLSLQDEVTRKTIENLQQATSQHKATSSPRVTNKDPKATASSTSSTSPRAEEIPLVSNSHSLHPEDLTATIINADELAYLASDSCFARCITRRSQLAMIILHLLSELSEWQMKRMQKAEELHSKKHEDLMQLEEPFSLEVRAACFSISHDLLRQILSPWLMDQGSEPKPVDQKEEEEDETKQDPTVDVASSPTATNHLYEMLQTSCQEFEAAMVANSKDLDPAYEHPRKLLSPDKSCVAVLQIITSNIRRLVLSHVDPVEIGIDPACLQEGDSFLPAPPALAPLVNSLEQMIALGTKRSDPFFPISLEAAAAMEVGMEAFYPSAQQRTELLTSRMGKGATLEIQVRWPVQERDQEDPRYERLILMLQFECIRTGMKHAIRGSWYFFMHLVVQVPSSEDTTPLFQNIFAPCIQRAGFSCWEVVAGAQEITINLQRHLHWNRVEKMSHDSGCGWIRVYPNEVATFNEVLEGIEQFLAQHDQKSHTTVSTTTTCAATQLHP